MDKPKSSTFALFHDPSSGEYSLGRRLGVKEGSAPQRGQLKAKTRRRSAATTEQMMEEAIIVDVNTFLAERGKSQVTRVTDEPSHYEHASEKHEFAEPIEQAGAGLTDLQPLFARGSQVKLGIEISRLLVTTYHKPAEDTPYNRIYCSIQQEKDQIRATLRLYYQSTENLLDEVCDRLRSFKNDKQDPCLLQNKRICEYLEEAQQLFPVTFNLEPISGRQEI